MSPRPNSTKTRRECVEQNRYTDPVSGRVMMDCYLCGVAIDLALSTTKNSQHSWEAEHTSPHFFGGEDVKPAHTSCHKTKTAKDQGDIAKSKRIQDKRYGIVRKQGFRKPPEGYVRDWKRGGRLIKAEEMDS